MNRSPHDGPDRAGRHALPRRSVHLDFHTGPRVPDVGAAFDPGAFARTFADAGVDSVTLFAKCHHGHLYYDTDRPERHPGLAGNLDLLGEQVAALRRVGVRTPIYLSLGVDEYAANAHPEWLALEPSGRQVGWSSGRFEPGWQVLDLSSPYQDYFAEQLAEVLDRFAPLDGVFVDMCWDQPSASRWAVDGMRRAGLDPADEGARARWARRVSHGYMRRFRDMVVPRLADDAAMSVWFNSRPKTALAEEREFVSHVDIEALPTGGWSYGYLPYVARYVRPLGLPAQGLTGRFHRSWGDNGGLKPAAALKYECCRMLAYGLASGVGDLLHPSGRLAPETYRLIGDVYAHLAACEPHLNGARPVAEAAVLMDPALGDTPGPAGAGVVRAMQRLRVQFDVLAPSADLDGYSLVVVPETNRMDEALAARLRAHLDGGGGLLIAGAAMGDEPPPELGVDVVPGSDPAGTFLRRHGERDGFAHALYESSRRMTARPGVEVLHDLVEPYFERSWDAFSGHDYTPADPRSGSRSGGGDGPPYAAVVARGRAVTVAGPLFTAFGRYAAEAHLDVLREAVARALPDPLVRTTGPAHLEALVVDGDEARVVHLLSFLAGREGDVASPITVDKVMLVLGLLIAHGAEAAAAIPAQAKGLDLVLDPFPLVDVEVEVRVDGPPSSVMLRPHDVEPEWEYRDGRVRARVTVPDGHGMLVLRR
ncbi:alpha-L-fucosidase [Streptosporangium sp. NPDC002607]